jgi:hypothetical protein
MARPRLTAQTSARTRLLLRARVRTHLRLEELETRTLLSTAFTPAQILHAYGFDQLNFNYGGMSIPADGRGQSIAIVNAYDDPTIYTDLQTFDAKYNLTDPGIGTFSFIKATPQGLPSVNAKWSAETALDVEWAHAIAPGASILLVETKTDDINSLLAGVDYAVGQGVQVVSISWGTGEFPAETSSAYDGHFTNRPGLTFVAASGDTGSPMWPAISTNVVGVGGTTLTVNSDNSWGGEHAWGAGSMSWLFGGSSGGVSKYEPKPDYQSRITISSNHRVGPDVSYNGNPSAGYSIYDSQNKGWTSLGGTSAGAPQFAALIAIADEGRMIAGLAPLSTQDVLNAIYNVSSADFHDITSGGTSHAAGPGYDMATGMGTPVANLLVPDLVSSNSLLVFSGTSSTAVSSGTVVQPAHRRGRIEWVEATESGTGHLTSPTAAPILDLTVTLFQPGESSLTVSVVIIAPPVPGASGRAVALPVAPSPETTGTRIESGSSEDAFDEYADPVSQSGIERKATPSSTPVPDQATPLPTPDALGTDEAWQNVAEAVAVPQAVLGDDPVRHEQTTTAAAVGLALVLMGARGLSAEDEKLVVTGRSTPAA